MFQKIKEELAKTNTELVAVSKTKSVAQIMEIHEQGQRIFGENRVQECVEKQAVMPKNIDWHIIGHLQTNKVKYIAPFVKLIHSVDSLKLLKEINKQAEKNGRIIDCLLQFHIAEEETKFGLDLEEAKAIINSDDFENMQNIQIVGVMGMATFTHNENQVQQEFRNLKRIFDNLKTQYFSTNQNFKEISMGMSGDYKIAVEEGSTMVRIGSLIFGGR